MSGRDCGRSGRREPAAHRLTWIALGLAAAAAAGALAPPRLRAQAAGATPAAVSTDTVWEGKVEVRGPLTVEKGATLLVLPGTTVVFGDPGGAAPDGPKAGLLVNGTLVAQGTPSQPVVFTSAAKAPAPEDWSGIAFDAPEERPSTLRHCVIEYATVGLGGSKARVLAERVTLRRNSAGVGAGREFALRLADADVTENHTGVSSVQGASMVVEGCRIVKNLQAGVYCNTNGSPRIVGNEITGNGQVGVSCYLGSSPLIEGNLIDGQEVGVQVELQSRPRIVRNEISGNGVGIKAEKLAFPVVEGNLVTRNGVGIYCNYSGYPQVHGNNLVDNRSFALVLGDNQSVKVEKLIPSRSQGRDQPAAGAADELPPQSRKFTPFSASDEGLVDARGNWWGEAAAREMAAAADGGNVSAIEDFFDKPETFYMDQPYPRDRVVWSPPEAAPIAAAGRPERRRSGISGKVVHAGQPAAGVLVHAYPGAAAGFAGEGAAYSAPSGPDGTFSLALPAGTWYLVAKAASPPFPHLAPGVDGLFGYYGGNPVTLGEGERREANLQVVRRRAVRVEPAPPPARTLLKGTVTGPKGLVEGASVFVYADASRAFRGPDLFGPQGAVPGGTDAAGAFEAEVPPGRYFVVAVRHAGGETLGPLKAGDLHGWFDGNPVELADGAATTIGVQVVEKLKDQEARTAAGPADAKRVGIRGTVRDPSGAVPAGVYAYATTDPNLMTGSMPPHRSLPVGADGAYFIELPGPGTYYVGARSGFGGPPLPGQWHGFHGAGKPAPVPVGGDGPAAGIDLTVRRME